VVGRLVEEQDVRALEQQAREDGAHLPAAGELAEIAVLLAGLEAEAVQDRERLVLAEEALEVIDPLVQLGDPFGGLELVLLGRARGGLELLLGRVQLGVELGAAGDAAEDEVAQAAPARDDELLRQPADAHALGADDLAVVDLLLAGDDAQQARLAGAVRADQAEAVAVPEAQLHLVEDHAICVEEGDVFEDDQAHGRPVFNPARVRAPAQSGIAGRTTSIRSACASSTYVTVVPSQSRSATAVIVAASVVPS
jgi:hypothetical protein